MTYQIIKQDIIDNNVFLDMYNQSEEFLYQVLNNSTPYNRENLIGVFNNILENSEHKYLGKYNDNNIALLIGENDKRDSNYYYIPIVLYGRLNNSRSWLYEPNGYWNAFTSRIQQDGFLGWSGEIITSGFIDNMLDRAIESGALLQQVERQVLNDTMTYIKITF